MLSQLRREILLPMIKEKYELGKANWLHHFKKHENDELTLDALDILDLYNLLKQSKWIGSGDDDDNSVLPIPVKKDSNGLSIKDYEVKDWFQKLNEELDEVKEYANQAEVLREYHFKNDPDEWYVPHIAEELQDLITVCTSYLDCLGFDQKKRIELTKHINEKNRMRGYFEED